MKIQSGLLLFVMCLPAWGMTYKINRKVLLRVPGTQKISKHLRTLDGLTKQDAFETQHFKIVLKKSDEALKLNHPDKDLQLKAASTLYHLTKARQFFANVMGSKRAKNLHQLTIRLEMTNGYSDLAHFTNDNIDPEFNNALSVPAGTPPDFVTDIEPWNEEIWFRPMKVISTADLPNNLGNNPLTTTLEELQKPIENYAMGQLRNDTVRALFWDGYTGPYWNDLGWAAGTFAVMKVIIGGSKKMDNLFLSDWYYLDTALVPEVVFHEYAHIILADKLTLSHSTPVIEGMADYFAANIANNYMVYGGVPGRSNSRAKDGLNENLYHIQLEHTSQASSDFVLSVLWNVKSVLPEVANELVYNARNYLSTGSSTIHDSLLRALLKSCRKVCKNPLRDNHKLFEAFKKKGL